MAENESLDLDRSPRMRVVFDAVSNGASCQEVTSKLENALIGCLRKTLKQFQEKGVTLSDLLKSRDFPQAFRQLLRKTQGHDCARLFGDAAATAGPTETDCVADWIDAILGKMTDQICVRVAGSENWPTIADVQAFTSEVRDALTPVVERMVTKLVEDQLETEAGSHKKSGSRRCHCGTDELFAAGSREPMKTQRLPFDLSYWSGDRTEVRHLRAGQHFRFDLDALNSSCLGDLPRHLVDLLRIASAVYVVDRLVKRRPKDGPKSPSRTIGLKVGVLDDDLWNRQAVRDCIHDALEFVTGDFWEIEFERDTQEYQWPDRFLPFSNTDDSPLTCLYSSGLDSAAGLVARMNEKPGRPVIPVTVWHQPRQRHLVRQQHDFLRRHYRSKGFGTRIEPLIVKVAMMWPSAAKEKLQERSQRSRSFLFTALGAITAIMHGQRTIEMFESGVGAINLPLMAGMVGSKATKSSHPEFLRLMSKLASLVADSDVNFILPFADKTKGEVVKALVGDSLQRFAAMTASCVGFPLRHSKQKQCGLCPACIFRRGALRFAGIQEPEDCYKYDFLGPAERVNQLPKKRLNYLKALLMQIVQLRGIEAGDRLPPAFERHIVGTGIVRKGQAQQGVIQLLARFRDEWTEIASAAQDGGHAWAKLLASKRPALQGVNHASA